MVGEPRTGQTAGSNQQSLPRIATAPGAFSREPTVPEETPDPNNFRPTLPQYDHSDNNTLPIIFGILRRLFWLLKHFGFLGRA